MFKTCVLYVFLNHLTELTTMSNFPRIYFHLTIAVTLILTISLLASAQASNRGSGGNNEDMPTYEDFKKIEQKCMMRHVRNHPVRVKPECQVFVNTVRCRGRCRSLTDFQLTPPFLTRDCACCRPRHDKVQYEVQELDCYETTSQGVSGQKTGERVKVAVPKHMDCQCIKCSKIING